MGAFWSHKKKLTVPGSGSISYILPGETPLERLTIWAISGQRNIPGLTFQPQINGVNFNTPTVVAGAQAADIVYASGGAATEDAIIPATFKPSGSNAENLDPFVFSILITNQDTNDIPISMYTVAVVHTGA